MAEQRDIEELKQELRDRAEELALDLFGDPPKRTRAEMRWGRKPYRFFRVGPEEW